MKVPLVDLTSQHKELERELTKAFQKVLSESAFINGPYLKEFEESFSKLMGSRYAVGLNSGTAALELACRALGIGPGDEVIVPANTYVATAEAVVAAGGVPVFADVSETDFHIDLEQAASLITEKTKLVIPVHLFGLACDMGKVEEFAKRHQLLIINDAAQAHLARFKDRSLDDFGEVSCWSFYPGKNLGALGDGGGITSNNKELCDQVRLLSDHGSSKKYHHEIPGFTQRLDGLQAACLSVKLRYLEAWTKRRQELAQRYGELLEDVDAITPKSFDGRSHVFHLYVVRVSNRDVILEKLQEKGVFAGIHYPYSLTQTPSMSPWVTSPCPVAEKLAGEILSLPLSPSLTEEQQDYVVDVLKEVVG